VVFHKHQTIIEINVLQLYYKQLSFQTGS